MSTPFLSEIKIVSFNFAPKGWAQCNGQLLPINQNQGLFSLLGTTYGGDGRVNFGLPDLRGRVPTHIHAPVNATSTAADLPTPTSNLLAQVDFTAFTTHLYQAPANPVAMAAATIGNTGGSQPHQNMQPFLTLMFCIALQGIFPSQT